MTLIDDISTASNEASTVADAFEYVLERVATHLGWPIGHAFVREGDELVPTNVWYLQNAESAKPFVEATRQIRFVRGVALGRILDHAEPMWILDSDSAESDARRAAAEEVGLLTALAFPVLLGGEVVSVLELGHTSHVAVDGDVLRLMADVGARVGRVVERERRAAALSPHGDPSGAFNRRVSWISGSLCRLAR